MTNLSVQPGLIETAAADVSQIRAAIGAANSAAVTPTSAVVAAAADEISSAIANAFNGYAKEFQGVLAQTAAFHDEFAALLASAGNAYVQAEAAIAAQLGITGSAVAMSAAPVDVAQVLIMTGSGTANPPLTYLNNVWPRYLQPFFNNLGSLIPVTTAEGLYPFTGTKDLTVDISLARGVTALQNAIALQISPSGTVTPGVNNIAVLGYSQSSIISSIAMPNLLAMGYSPEQIHFTLLGNPANPNGGLFARFPGLSLPSLGATFGHATPSNDFPTTIYTLEYDGFADFPRYPINLLADVNALAGIVFIHGTYPHLTPDQLASAFLLPGSQSLGTPDSMTDYYMIPTKDLPILTPLRAIPLIGDPVADLIEPNMRAIINWGYGDPNYGYSTSPANIPTQFEFLPPLSATQALGPALISGTQQGIHDFSLHFQGGPPTAANIGQAISAATGGMPTLALGAPTSPQSFLSNFLTGVQTANTNVVGTLTTDFSTAYAVLLPTADIATAVLISLPSYNVNLFIDGLQQALAGDPTGGLINAFGRPIAASVGLVTLATGFELITIENALTTILTGEPIPGPQ